MRVLVYGSDLDPILSKIEALGIEVVEKDPEVIISHGGDGTFLGAEREWPGIPKLAIRPSRNARKCERHEDDVLLGKLQDGSLNRVQLIKLEGRTGGKALLGMNEITVNRRNPTAAVRYKIRINGTPYSGEVIGDGLVVATPFGSTAYYRSITHSYFQVGIGLAFNNSTERIHHVVLAETAEIEVEVTRGPALLAADNDPNQPVLSQGDVAVIRRHPTSSVVLGIDSILCTECRRLLREPFQISERLPFWDS